MDVKLELLGAHEVVKVPAHKVLKFAHQKLAAELTVGVEVVIEKDTGHQWT